MNFNDKWFNNQKYITHDGPGTHPYQASRRVSSVNFLLNLPMANEAKIMDAGVANANRLKAMDYNDGDAPDIDEHDVNDPQSDHPNSDTDEVLTARRNSEDHGTIPRAVSDALESRDNKDYFVDDPRGERVFEVPLRDWRGCSYKPLFKPMAMMTEEKFAVRAAAMGASSNPNSAFIAERLEMFSSEYLEKGFLYDPDLLDDPIMLEDTDRFVSENTGPIISSILLYVNDNELKDSLNDQFRERHPQMPLSLTLSRIRALKKKILTVCVQIGYEISTVAYAMVNFERLCLKNRVNKGNRKVAMAVSVLLAIKFVEYESAEASKKKLDQLFNFFDREWDLDKQEILDAEFGAYVMLGFNLHVPYPHIFLVYTRLLKLVAKENIAYLGEDMHDVYRMDVLQVEKWRELNRQTLELEAKEEVEAATEHSRGRHDSLGDDPGEGVSGSGVKSTFNKNFFELMIQIGAAAPSPNMRTRMSLGSEKELPHGSPPSTPTSVDRRNDWALTRSNSVDAQATKTRNKRTRSSSKSSKTSLVKKFMNLPALLGLSSSQLSTSPSPTFEDGAPDNQYVGMSLGKAFEEVDNNPNGNEDEKEGEEEGEREIGVTPEGGLSSRNSGSAESLLEKGSSN